MTPSGRGLRALAAVAVGLVILAPVLFGLWQTGRAAFGILPALGRESLSLEPWRALAALPGIATSLRLTLLTGIGATLGALALATGFCALATARPRRGFAQRLMAPFLAVPHAAMAVGLAFVLAPSGWIARLVAPLAGWDRPPALATVNDSWGIALMLGLMVKEVPFLVLVMLSALSQIPVGRHLAAARALGYARGVAWIKVILPQLWPMIRLPVLVVLSYGLSVVDMAIILGPSNPPTLAVALTRWFADPDPAMILPASAGALLQAGLVALAAGLVLGAEAAARPLGRWWLRRGGRGLSAGPGLRLAGGAVAGLMALGVLSLLALALWSLAWRWPWPAVLPQEWSVALWAGAGGGWADALANTVILAGASAGLGLVLAVLWLEAETGARFAAWVRPLVYLPLLVPQIGFLYGLNVGLLQIGLSGGMAAVVWAQLLFVFPYVIIALGDPWRRLDPRLIRAAAALGAGPLRRLWAVKLPVLLRPVLTAAAIGVAVSVAQYLPTLFMGAGRIATLTTEAVTLSSGADRRVTGVYGTLQAAVPLIGYAAALAVPALVHRNRRALWGAAPA